MFNKQENAVIKKWIKKIKAIKYLGGKCENCHDTDIRHLSFHHTNSNEKEGILKDIIWGHWSLVEKEIKKCILLCHNCHAEHHYTGKSYVNITKKTFIEYKGSGCKKCGYNKCNAALTFHHLDKSTKSFGLTKTRNTFKSVQDITEKFSSELDKCELLCANCHSEEHIVDHLYLYALNNYDSIKVKEISQKFDRKKIYELYFNQNKTQKEITEIIGIKKSTLSMIIKDFGTQNNLLSNLDSN